MGSRSASSTSGSSRRATGARLRPRSRPLRVRPGVRFACVGDGLCCADVHAVGPISPRERAFLRLLDDEVVQWNPVARAHVLATKGDGTCVFLGEGGCAIHARLGPAAKPRGCRRFPIGLTATPDGGRITTEHRCPCRTMGAGRPPLEPSAARPAILDDRDRPRPDLRIAGPIPTTPRSSVPWATWTRREAAILDALAAGGEPGSVLGVAPFPPLRDGSWRQVGHDLLETATDGRTRFHAALAWAGWSLLTPAERDRVGPPPRPWADVFARVADRVAGEPPRDPDAMVQDLVADEIWSLRWAARRSFREASADLVSRAAIARSVADALPGPRRDLAMAEAIAVVELLGESDAWTHALTLVGR